jgi:hypothetical protein
LLRDRHSLKTTRRPKTLKALSVLHCGRAVQRRRNCDNFLVWFARRRAVLGIVILAACSNSAKALDVTGTIRDSLNQAGLKDVSVGQDRDKGVVTLKEIAALRPTRKERPKPSTRIWTMRSRRTWMTCCSKTHFMRM